MDMDVGQRPRQVRIDVRDVSKSMRTMRTFWLKVSVSDSSRNRPSISPDVSSSSPGRLQLTPSPSAFWVTEQTVPLSALWT